MTHRITEQHTTRWDLWDLMHAQTEACMRAMDRAQYEPDYSGRVYRSAVQAYCVACHYRREIWRTA